MLKYVQLLTPEVASDDWARFRAEAAALDIASPLYLEMLRECLGDQQELASDPVLVDFMDGLDLPPAQVRRIIWMACHHHAPLASDEPDFRLLMEADLLADVYELNIDLSTLRQRAVLTMHTRTGQQELRRQLKLLV